MTDNAAGWQADPTGRHEHRYWDGSQWTDNVSDAGVASTDAYAVADAPAPDAADVPDAAEPPVAEAPGWAEPTTTMPTASTDPTASWPTTPAPPAPPSYTPPPPATGGPLGPDGSGGSKRGLLIGGGILAAVAVAVAAFLLLGGGDDGDDDVRTQLAAQFRANSELTNDQADCIADHVVDEMGADAFKDVDFTADEPPEAIQEELFTAAVEQPGEVRHRSELLHRRRHEHDRGRSAERWRGHLRQRPGARRALRPVQGRRLPGLRRPLPRQPGRLRVRGLRGHLRRPQRALWLLRRRVRRGRR